MSAFVDSHRRWGYKRARARSKGASHHRTRRVRAPLALRGSAGTATQGAQAQPERRPGASRGSVGDRRAPGSPTRTPGPRDESPAGGGFGPIPTPIAAPIPGDRITIQMVTGGRRWDSLTADTDAVTLGRRPPGPTVGPSHSPTASSTSSVRALIGRVGGTGPWADPSHFPAASVSSPPNVVSSCSTISACFFSLRVTFAANTAAEATMIARGT